MKRYLWICVVQCMLVHTTTLANIVVQEIPIASLPKSKTEFRDTYYKRKPVIFKGLAQSWEASEWDLDFFEKAYGTNMVSIQIKEELTGSLQGPVRTVCIHQSLKDTSHSAKWDTSWLSKPVQSTANLSGITA
jgi:hypothetical protein